MEEKFKVDFIGIGTLRSATTWIFRCLEEHPEICVSSKKETRFFNDDSRYRKKFEYYYTFFSHCDRKKIKGEFDPTYLYSASVAQRIKDHFPNVKLIVCLRNPIERSYSYFLKHKIIALRPERNFDQILDNPGNIYIKTGTCADSLKHYFKLFGRKNILVLIYEDIEKNPVTFIQKIYEFLGVDEHFIPETVGHRINFVGSKKSKVPAITRATYVIEDPFFNHSFIKKFVPALKKLGLHNVRKLFMYIRKVNVKNSSKKTDYVKPPMSDKTRNRLRYIFHDDIKKLEKLLNRDLSFWR